MTMIARHHSQLTPDIEWMRNHPDLVWRIRAYLLTDTVADADANALLCEALEVLEDQDAMIDDLCRSPPCTCDRTCQDDY